jgi:2-hydroxychromene-2-carboxylate isomerase
MTEPTVAFWYEFSSPYSFLAAERVDDLARPRGVRVVWKPFLLGAIFREQGPSPNLRSPQRSAYMWRDCERWCDRLGLPFVVPDPFPQNGVFASRVAMAVPDDERPAFSRAVYRALFCQGLSLADDDVVTEALRQTEIDLETAVSAARTDLVKHALRKQTDEALARGIFGAPMIETADGELFWGNDRLDEALDWALGNTGAAAR